MSGNVRRYYVRLCYNGTSYRGTQKQASGNILDIDSVQGAVESAFFKLAPRLTKAPSFVFAGRTDVGVHALSTAAHVDLERLDGAAVDKLHMLKMMNRYLINNGHQIRIFEFHQVGQHFHARHSAKRREYLYRFLVPREPDFHQVPLAEMDKTLHVHYDRFDLDRFKGGLELFKGTKDFTTFTSRSFYRNQNPDDYVSYVRDMDCRMEEAPPLLEADPQSHRFHFYHVHFSSRGFLYKQIRKIMGTLFALAANKLSEKDVQVMLQVPNRTNYRYATASPHGLYLKTVEYDKDDIKEIFEN